MKKMYMVRAGKDSYLIDRFKDEKIVSVGFKLPDLSKVNSKEELKGMINDVYPEKTNIQIGSINGVMWKFKDEFKIDDYVISYNSTKRIYLVGIIKSEYMYCPKFENSAHIRKVKWCGEVNRDNLKVNTTYSLGSLLSIFELNEDVKEEILNLLENGLSSKEEVINENENKEDESILKEETIEKSIEFIKDKVSKLDWSEMQNLVAGLLRAMGYKTIVSPKGSDRGKDIIASPDGLGLEDPKIRVEVKHRNNTIGASDIRSFIGGLPNSVKGLYVSTGGFTKEAKYEAERSKIPLTLIDLDRLVYFIIQYYDNFDIEAQALVPLTKIYWPN
ncbi:MAG: restriction endonuclease [Methanobacteriaceae archaeon]|nr:restriction endonuclease [Methanobacteriaceae archaeon]